MKLIRELRMGAPKCGKTVAVLGTYPKPMLVFQFDTDGCDVIPATLPAAPNPKRITLDVTYKEIIKIKPEEFASWCAKPASELPKILVVDFAQSVRRQMTDQFTPVPDAAPYTKFYKCVNTLVATKEIHWKTYVLDTCTTLIDSLKSFVSANNTSWLQDARKWSPAVGGKVLQHIAVLNSLPLHCVYLAHSQQDKNETTGEIKESPLGPGGFAAQVGSLVSQFLYATNESGTLQVWTSPKGNVKSIGCRWPSDLPQVCSADFKTIYGKEL